MHVFTIMRILIFAGGCAKVDILTPVESVTCMLKFSVERVFVRLLYDPVLFNPGRVFGIARRYYSMTEYAKLPKVSILHHYPGRGGGISI